MNIKEFIKKYTGKPVDFDGYYGTQCMDLMHFYVYNVLGLKDKAILAAPSAKLVYENFRWGNYFEKIDNTPKGIPEEGDIIFWGGGQWGHVAIFLKGDVNEFISFDANYPIGTLPHKQYHNYFNVLGWLRIKDKEADDVTLLQGIISGLELKLEVSKGNEIKLVAEINKLDKNYADLKKIYAKEVKELSDQRDNCQKDYADFHETCQSVFDENNETIEYLDKCIIELKKGGTNMKITEYFDKLPKSVKVLIYVAVSSILAELIIELGGFEQTLLIRSLAGIINIIIVALEKEIVPAVKTRLKK